MNKKPNDKIKTNLNHVFTMLTFFLIYVFLRGKIIDIPFGTHEGGIIAGIGVAIILVGIIFLIFITHQVVNLYTKKQNEKNNNKS